MFDTDGNFLEIIHLDHEMSELTIDDNGNFTGVEYTDTALILDESGNFIGFAIAGILKDDEVEDIVLFRLEV